VSARYQCACCHYWTLREAPAGTGTYDICPVCFWEDDRSQFDDPDLDGGANHPSLNQARANFQEFGAAERRLLHLVRAPTPAEISGPPTT